MTNTAITETHEYDAFCDCTSCNAQLQAGPAAVNANLVRTPDNFDNETAETPAPTSAPCLRCHRTLRSAKSIAAKYGATCARKMAAAAKVAAQSQPAARVEKAADAIETGAVAQAAPNRFQVVSSDGSKTYDVDLAAGSCTCKAAQFGRSCYHVTSAALLAA
jgi:hypothetical protein